MKNGRQKKIIEIIENNEIETQEELVDRLKAEGFNVTQATVSRDIRTLSVYKKAIGDGRQKYAVEKENDHTLDGKFKRVLRDGFVSIDMAQNILVIKTVSGMAMAVAAAVDAMHFKEIVGTIAGDDTIMMAVRTVEDTRAVMKKINLLLNE
ncbi:MAG: arginine repressor [Lachnospiraceae bacterium]|nr:arginine repressor [Lachnospiraceae bacterium]